MPPRLVLIEGLFGSGKTTSAERLARTLSARGVSCRAYHEFAPDHPIPIDPDQIEALIQQPDILRWAEQGWRGAAFPADTSVVIVAFIEEAQAL